jgi:dipeptidyl aminopeptidase/acylaminoacyl peptidase
VLILISFPKPDVEQFFRTFGIQSFAVSPDEKQVVFSTNISGKYNLWAMDVENRFPYALTFRDQSTSNLKYDPLGRHIYAFIDQDGDENWQMYAIPTDGGVPQPIRYVEGKQHSLGMISKDGERIYYTSNKDNPTYMNVYKYDLTSGEEQTVLEGEGASTFFVSGSPDESSFVFVKHHANTYTPAFIKLGEEIISLVPDIDEEYTISGVTYLNSATILFNTNYQSDFTYLAKFDIETRSFERLLEKDREEFSQLKVDNERGVAYIVSVKGVVDTLYKYDLQTGEVAELPLPCDVIDSLNLAESGTLYALGRSAVRPFNLYKMGAGEAWERLTNYRVPGVSEGEMADPEVFTYPSYDGTPIEAMLFEAKPENSNGHLILWPHGGPQSAERKGFRSLFQFLVHRGFSIFAPNFRGSTGYGLEFKKSIEGDWGYGPRLDNIEGLEWLIKNGKADRNKIFLMGGSYGGYMALLLHGRHSEYFKAVVDIFGPSDLFSFIDSVPDHWKPIMSRWVGDPVKDREKLIEYSPITHLDGMNKPMLVIQGANDPRVVKAESDKIVEALREQGREVEYLVLNDEGHGFSKKENEMKVYRLVLEFLERYM